MNPIGGAPPGVWGSGGRFRARGRGVADWLVWLVMPGGVLERVLAPAHQRQDALQDTGTSRTGRARCRTGHCQLAPGPGCHHRHHHRARTASRARELRVRVRVVGRRGDRHRAGSPGLSATSARPAAAARAPAPGCARPAAPACPGTRASARPCPPVREALGGLGGRESGPVPEGAPGGRGRPWRASRALKRAHVRGHTRAHETGRTIGTDRGSRAGHGEGGLRSAADGSSRGPTRAARDAGRACRLRAITRTYA
ncbi:hypothetical protein SAMN04490357_0010 [Streptomyces misionensis]|uniref:Uncharacterized protein n=1 Tax=Streptomyces misionensis TaxID=67331 RepID=A0A1H4I6H1_9ACTN|nr:hypothetical protein SAMN04490357_0010 [Streptomyces misionensis]